MFRLMTSPSAARGLSCHLFRSISRTTSTRVVAWFSAQPTASSSSSSSDDSSSTSSSSTPTTSFNPEGTFDKIAFIGTGKMAQALLQPMIRTGLQPAEKVAIYDVAPAIMQGVQDQFPGLHISDHMAQAVDGADLILCAVKPQNLTEKFFYELRKEHTLRQDAIFLSVIAGKTIQTFEQGTGLSKIVRAMPNTPAQVGEGMTVWSCTEALTASDRTKIQQVLSSCGKSMYVDDESFIDMATSISGSGPAYIFLLMESMIDGAVHMGFPRDKATTLVYHTMLGSTLYAMETGEHPAVLRNLVTSPSGTTASALYELENGRIRTVIKDAMWACYRRSLEMGNHDSNVGPGRVSTPEPRIVISHESDHHSSGYKY